MTKRIQWSEVPETAPEFTWRTRYGAYSAQHLLTSELGDVTRAGISYNYRMGASA